MLRTVNVFLLLSLIYVIYILFYAFICTITNFVLHIILNIIISKS